MWQSVPTWRLHEVLNPCDRSNTLSTELARSPSHRPIFLELTSGVLQRFRGPGRLAGRAAARGSVFSCQHDMWLAHVYAEGPEVPTD